MNVRLSDTKALGEVKALDDFYQMLQNDANRTFYGYVYRALHVWVIMGTQIGPYMGTHLAESGSNCVVSRSCSNYIFMCPFSSSCFPCVGVRLVY